MYHKTQAVVLSVNKYSDKYSIAHLFTREFGRVSYILPRTSGKKAKVNPLLFSPLAILNIEAEHKPKREIQRLKETQRAVLMYDLGTNMTKISIAFFLSEFLTKVVRETDDSVLLFEYLKNSIQVLEESDNGLANFHLTFLFGLTRFLGINPNLEEYEDGCFFDMIYGEFTHSAPLHQQFLKGEECLFLHKLSRINYTNMHLFKLSKYNRNIIVDRMLAYYKVHVHDFPALKSLDILSELF